MRLVTAKLTRVGKFALIQHQRYAHAKQFKRANRALRRLKTYLGRVIRDIERKIKDNPALNDVFRAKIFLAGRVLARDIVELGVGARPTVLLASEELPEKQGWRTYVVTAWHVVRDIEKALGP